MDKRVHGNQMAATGPIPALTARSQQGMNAKVPQREQQQQQIPQKPTTSLQVTKKEDEPRFWPSARIPQGGLFHSPKFQYSQETADLIRCKYSMLNTRARVYTRK